MKRPQIGIMSFQNWREGRVLVTNRYIYRGPSVFIHCLGVLMAAEGIASVASCPGHTVAEQHMVCSTGCGG